MPDDRHGPPAHAVLHTHLVLHFERHLLLAEPPNPREIRLQDSQETQYPTSPISVAYRSLPSLR
jgi:hypothetical protein